jgi:hypothetical protein
VPAAVLAVYAKDGIVATEIGYTQQADIGLMTLNQDRYVRRRLGGFGGRPDDTGRFNRGVRQVEKAGQLFDV